MSAPLRDLIVPLGTSVRAALAPLDRAGAGFLMVVRGDGTLAGVLTDGDIRRALLAGVTVDHAIDTVMPPSCVSLAVESTTTTINAALSGRIAFVPLVDAAGRPVDYASHSHHRRYPVMEPLLDGNEADYVLECVRTAWVSSQGRFVGMFEQMMADFHGVPHALAVCNGTAALHLALVSLGIGAGDEVIVPDFTFASTASVVIHAGATPVFVDVDPRTWTIDVDAVERAITPRTKAVMPVHLYGYPCDMPRLMALARVHRLRIIEDAAEALGARVGGRLAGSFGDASAFSFFGNKTITTGEGGMLLFRDAAVYERARMLRDHGMSRERRYWHLEAGFNYRLTNLQAAIGVAQMERVESILARKRALAARYDAALAGTPGLTLPPRTPGVDPVFWLYTIMIAPNAGLTRDDLAQRLVLNGIETRPTFYPVHVMPPFERFAAGAAFPATEALAAAGLSLPSAVTLADADIDAVAGAIKTILRIRGMAVSAGSVE